MLELLYKLLACHMLGDYVLQTARLDMDASATWQTKRPILWH